jgi:hypothetical protein
MSPAVHRGTAGASTRPFAGDRRALCKMYPALTADRRRADQITR